jgi:DeoR/GlpR family transcriptional regulator of sugar metabolism
MISTSKKVVVLSISEKINASEQLKICDVDEIDVLITELPPNAKKLLPYKKKGIQIL